MEPDSKRPLLQPVWDFIAAHLLLSILSVIAFVSCVSTFAEVYGGSNSELIFSSIPTAIALTIGLASAVHRLRSKEQNTNRFALWALVGFLLFMIWYMQFLFFLQLEISISLPVQFQPLLQSIAYLLILLFPAFQPLTVIAYILEGRENGSIFPTYDKAEKSFWSGILFGFILLCLGVMVLTQSTPTSDPRSVWLSIGTGLIASGFTIAMTAIWQYTVGM